MQYTFHPTNEITPKIKEIQGKKRDEYREIQYSCDRIVNLTLLNHLAVGTYLDCIFLW